MQTPRRFLDFIIDGESLYDRHGLDLISPLGWFVPPADEKAARQLLLEEPSEFGHRVEIYVCPECGDRYCGSLTAIVERQGEEIVWRDIASTTFDFFEAEAWQHENLPLAEWPELRFAAAEYVQAIANRPSTTGVPGGAP